MPKSMEFWVLVLEDHTHHDLRMNHFHVAVNPCHNLHHESCPKMNATCSAEPNVIRAAISSTYNASVAKANMIGGYHGISPF